MSVQRGHVSLDLEPSGSDAPPTRYRVLRDGALVGAAWADGDAWSLTLRAHPDLKWLGDRVVDLADDAADFLDQHEEES